MAGFDPSKDVTLDEWCFGSKDEPETFIVGVYQYNGGKKKLGFTRTFRNYRTQEIGIKGAGRLTIEDVEHLASILPKALDLMKDNAEGEEEPIG